MQKQYKSLMRYFKGYKKTVISTEPRRTPWEPNGGLRGALEKEKH